MKILFISAAIPNYVVDGLFHGLRATPGITVVDIPRIDYMYHDASPGDLMKTGSRGNTLYKLLPEAREADGKRTFWQRDIEAYDYVIFTDIFHQCDLFHTIYKSIHPTKRDSLCIVDGNDITARFPFYNHSYNLKLRPWSYLYNFSKVKYFKREYENVPGLFGVSGERYPKANKFFSIVFSKPVNYFPISMSIPEQHIEYISWNAKCQQLVNYNVDEELSELFPERPASELGKWQPAYENQQEYFEDIKRSRFGITAKRAGWDCLRHYEYAAKGAILCFKNLERKNEMCAPFGLNATNCISYRSRQDLSATLGSKTQTELETIQGNQYCWIQNHTTRKVAGRFLDTLCASAKRTVSSHTLKGAAL